MGNQNNRLKKEMKKKIAVLMGGPSSEKKVSLKTGLFVSKSLNELGYIVKKIKVSNNVKNLISNLKDFKPHVVFNALHGTFGEDGSVQRILKSLKLLYTHSGIHASSTAMDKNKSKILFNKIKIPTPRSLIIDKKNINRYLIKPPFLFPLVVKPVSEGSSVGVKICKNLNELKKYKMHKLHRYLIEEFIPGKELTVGIMNNKALDVIELKTKKDFYDYKSKYTKGMTRYIIPAPIPKDIERKCKQYALKIHKHFGCKGVTRTDFRYNERDHSKNKLYVLEINTQPGMTPLSLVPMMAKKNGISFNQLVESILKDV